MELIKATLNVFIDMVIALFNYIIVPNLGFLIPFFITIFLILLLKKHSIIIFMITTFFSSTVNLLYWAFPTTKFIAMMNQSNSLIGFLSARNLLDVLFETFISSLPIWFDIIIFVLGIIVIGSVIYSFTTRDNFEYN